MKIIAYICCYKIVKNMVEGILIGFLIGFLAGGWYASWFIGMLKRKGYVKFDVTQKFIDEMKNK